MASRHYKRLLICNRVVVNLLNGDAIEGVMTDQDGPLLVLQDANLHAAGASAPTPMDGRIVIDVDRVAFIQSP